MFHTVCQKSAVIIYTTHIFRYFFVCCTTAFMTTYQLCPACGNRIGDKLPAHECTDRTVVIVHLECSVSGSVLLCSVQKPSVPAPAITLPVVQLHCLLISGQKCGLFGNICLIISVQAGFPSSGQGEKIFHFQPLNWRL